jgi:hypothetical protein
MHVVHSGLWSSTEVPREILGRFVRSQNLPDACCLLANSPTFCYTKRTVTAGLASGVGVF